VDLWGSDTIILAAAVTYDADIHKLKPVQRQKIA
jgi:hypothetical protein